MDYQKLLQSTGSELSDHYNANPIFLHAPLAPKDNIIVVYNGRDDKRLCDILQEHSTHSTYVLFEGYEIPRVLVPVKSGKLIAPPFLMASHLNELFTNWQFLRDDTSVEAVLSRFNYPSLRGEVEPAYKKVG